MRTILIFLVVFAPLFAYKNAFFIGGYGSMQDGEITASGDKAFGLGSDDVTHKVKDNKLNNGLRFGWHNNSDHTNLAKTKYEFFYEKRRFDYKLSGNRDEFTGYHLGFSIALGYNIDILTTHEVIPYFKVGAGAGKFDRLGTGTDLMMGVGVAYTTRYFELTAGVDREFWQLKGIRFPFHTPFSNDGYIHNYQVGLNFKF